MKQSVLAAMALAMTTAMAVPEAFAQEKNGSFFDDFKSLDADRWLRSDGWTNGSHQGCTWSEQEVMVKEGILELTMRIRPKGGNPYTCAEVQSRERYGYGMYEARIRGVAGSGLNSSVFTYIGPPLGVPSHDEVDIEILGKNPTQAQLNYYVDGQGKHEEYVDLGFDVSKDFHHYGFEWQKDYIRWYVDGRMIHEVKSDKLPSHPSKLFLSLWSGSAEVNDWLGPFKFPEERPKYQVDWISYTKTGEACLFPQSLTCKK